MSAFTILIAELTLRGATTYARLVRVYGDDYDYYSFTAAVHRARALGLVKPPTGKYGGAIEPAVGAKCPCCGRALQKERV